MARLARPLHCVGASSASPTEVFGAEFWVAEKLFTAEKSARWDLPRGVGLAQHAAYVVAELGELPHPHMGETCIVGFNAFRVVEPVL